MDHSGWTERALEMKTKLAAHEATETTNQEFADAEGISVSAVGYWRRRLRDLESRSSRRSDVETAPAFLPVRVVSTSSSETMELRTRTGLTIRLSASFDEAALTRLLRVIESC